MQILLILEEISLNYMVATCSLIHLPSQFPLEKGWKSTQNLFSILNLRNSCFQTNGIVKKLFRDFLIRLQGKNLIALINTSR